MPLSYRLDRRRPQPVAAPALDPAQQAVVDHPGGPLLVLAGPGTGKTTTIVEAVVDLVERRGVSPESALVLTFSRKAAHHVRDRITARLGRTTSAEVASTFHSFAYALIRRHQPADLYEDPLRLLSAPEQDVVMRELLSDAAESVAWPPSLDRALGTRGFSREVQRVLARAREKGLDPADLDRLGREADLPAWRAAAAFMEQYLTVLDSSSALDYPELIFRAVLLAERPDVQAELRERHTHVFVDEYQDTDPSQVRLLQALAGDGRHLVVVGDPDQSIYAFRGADVRGVFTFPRAFASPAGDPAPVLPLTTTRRFGPRLLEASRRIADRLPARGSIGSRELAAFRSPAAEPVEPAPGIVETFAYDTARAETEHLADLLRRAHLVDGVPWSEMAVLVRSGRATIPSLRRSLTAAGVPVEVASDDTPLVDEPAVLPLLDALRVVVNLDNDDPRHPDHVDAAKAESLLLSPLGDLDAGEIRVLARQLRARELEAATADGRTPRPSPELVRAAVLDPTLLAGLTGVPAEKAGRLGGVLGAARASADADATAEDVLWSLWSATPWPQRLRAAVEGGGSAARLAHRDLDAVCALFDVAARAEEQRGHTSIANFLASLSAQQIPADTLAERGVRGSAVRLLTAHRSKGLEWRLVVVAHCQEGSWPDLRRRSTLLQADRIGDDGILPPLTAQALLDEERRLFYVACTRARERLVVTAVRSPDDDGEQPSRFLDEVADEVTVVEGRPPRPLSLAGLVAELRRAVSDEELSEPLRAAAARRLATLADAEHDGRPLAPHADPARWWGVRPRSRAAVPLRDPDEPVTLSASALEALLACPAKWFLEREAGGTTESSASQGFGLLVHALADRIAKGELDPDDDLMGHVDAVWGQLVFRTPWSSAKERTELQAALERFARWHQRSGGREVVATEHPLAAEVVLPDGQHVRLRGFADRLELDADGQVWVVDLKTGKYPPPDRSLATHAQLGLYQHAVNNGAVDDLAGAGARAGGAELVQLRREVGGEAKVQRQPAPEPDADGVLEIERQLAGAARAVRGESFPARPGEHCERCAFHAICPVKGAGTVLS